MRRRREALRQQPEGWRDPRSELEFVLCSDGQDGEAQSH
jgi:hypothetical protein